ncbi:uncharacterized protein CDAR_499331 [Caerostris darwini]|uniref:Uncharacterized protein n=1 Tax=Caerostris darwini TaxID=1538125 RepID=A0AAV4NZQ3_9ARAC|nr:uncharacterized protein CDAR_499331 [Caerostris darwini]
MFRKKVVLEPLKRCIDLNTVPQDGFEHLYYQRLLEANQKYGTTCFHKDYKPTPKEIFDPSNADPGIHRVIVNSELDKYYDVDTIIDFLELHDALMNNKEYLKIKFPEKFTMPDGERELCNFCLGCNTCASIFYVNDGYYKKNFTRGHSPLLSIVVHMHGKKVLLLLKYLYQWFLVIGINKKLFCWVYALLTVLNLPDDDKCNKEFFTEFYNACCMKLKTFNKREKRFLGRIAPLLCTFM